MLTLETSEHISPSQEANLERFRVTERRRVNHSKSEESPRVTCFSRKGRLEGHSISGIRHHSVMDLAR